MDDEDEKVEERGEPKGPPDFAKYKDVHVEALARFKRSVDAENDNREAARDDIKWRLGEQWDEKTKKTRKKRPTLTINRLDDFVRRTVNEIRKNRLSIKVGAADSKASDEVASIMGGMIRAIERNSHADIAYDTAIDQAVGSAFGHFRIITEYTDDDSFVQELRLERIANQFSVYSDPDAISPSWFDGKYRFVSEMFEPDAFEDKYGFVPLPFEDAGQSGDEAELWWDGAKVRVAEYWRVIESPVMLHLMPDNEVVQSDGNDAEDKKKFDEVGVYPLKSRKSTKRIVECYLMTGQGCFKKEEYKGRYIPIVSVIGEEVTEGDKRHLKSLIRDAKDPQRMLNYWKSIETELLAGQPKSPVFIPRGSIDAPDLRKKWDSSNTETWPYLEYEVVAGLGPQRQPPPTFPTAAREGANGAIEDMKAVMGIHDASLGSPGNEQSGVAIFERKLQGDVSTYHFVDNLARAQREAGTIIVDLIPHVYDTERMVRIVGQDGKSEQKVKVNGPTIVNGKPALFALDVGKYDVSVSAGPSFTTQREEAARYQMAMMQANPAVGQAIGDLVVKNMEWPQADEMAARIRKSLPPHITGDAPHPMVQQQIDQGKQQLQQAQQQLGQMQTENQALKDFIRSEAEANKRAMAELAQNAKKVEGDQAIAFVKAISDRIKALAAATTANANAKATEAGTAIDVAGLVNEMNTVADTIMAEAPMMLGKPGRVAGNSRAQ